jgi:UDP-N-acetylglucosamine diphosphorylase/glucosamine-1-phosphate N-acetyltransferase
MTIYLDESFSRSALMPFTATRHVADIRVGILTIAEKWEKLCGARIIRCTGLQQMPTDGLVIPAHLIPTVQNVAHIIEAATNHTDFNQIPEILAITKPWHLFMLNAQAITADFEWLTRDRVSAPIPEGTRTIAPENIFVEPGAEIMMATLNASTGCIYIGKNAQIMEGAHIRGPFAAGEGAAVKMGATIYGGTSIGPHCVVGGEIKNSLLMGYSNKAHEGYLGDSVIGEWCNLGAGTSNSNVKNTGGEIWYHTEANIPPVAAGTKAGLLMGDYSRAAINTSFNTGTIVGVCCNIFGEMPAKLVNHFSWGNKRYIFEKAVIDISNWKKMKGQVLTASEQTLLEQLYLSTQP